VFLNARRRLRKDHGGGGLESRDEDAICGRWFIQVWYYDGQGGSVNGEGNRKALLL
jgi:hypothetical protein